ncbi:cation-translocating P-type ATPase [Bythopirellula polymerisocia]|uniref:Putative cation-transporting ATPase F n=1 Tax=Bythopirellula polymerisocia TaxID=2528003 RepID=A0A5C6CPU9_9BACT|nr:HAD-IC family P-type ATPase [Bythopirellula polymerisocia]TWU24789.1 putative cation-transporting ATPase F [Bythopirellula polymerisocia]
MDPQSQQFPAWHALDLQSVQNSLDSEPCGLTGSEAAERLEKLGPNVLPHAPHPTWWQIALRQFHSPLIYILGIAAVVSVAIGETTDATFIAAVLLLNALIGGYQEWRAEKSTQALQRLLQIRAAVLRDGEVCEMDAEKVVPGDTVWLESGNRVPADLRIISAHGLEVDESLLTGESLAVSKDPTWTGAVPTPVGDRKNMTFAGSIVVRGRAQGMVVATGPATHVGQLALDVMSATGGKPPLIERLERFTLVVAVAVLIAACAVAVLGVLLHNHSLHDMFLFSIALAVSAIPEGLPVALTVALAIGTARMARRGVIVRRLAAVEGLGSCTLIASDKTGTLTCNELTVREIRLPNGERYEVSGEGFIPEGQVTHDGHVIKKNSHPVLDSLARVAVLCNEADLHRRNGEWHWRGDAVDLALLTMAHKLGWTHETSLANKPQINEIPFEPERQFAASYHRADGATQAYVKGAPEKVFAMCDWGPGQHENEASSKAEEMLRFAELMGEQGYRVLALAEGTTPAPLDPALAAPEPSNLSFLGFVGMIDPLRPGVHNAVRACHGAGVGTCMITGDHPVTALAIARELGLASESSQVVTGSQLAKMSPTEMEEAVKTARVFARVAPRQKLELVNAARRVGHYVAVTGDGVNDAPALRAANIGVAMGKSGTDVAREAAELVLSDDNFATIVAGIEEGRVAYDNVRKVIYLLISTGAAEIVLVGLALLVGLPLPLLAVQLLWLNLVTNGIQDVALAFEPSEGDVLSRAPRPPSESIFNRLMIERTIVAALVMGFVGFGAFWWMLRAGWTEAAARNALLLLMVLFENVHIGNCRSETKSALRLSPLRSPILLGGAIIALLIHFGAMFVPLGQKVLHIEPISLATFAYLWALALSVFFAMEIHKWNWAMRTRREAVSRKVNNIRNEDEDNRL